MRGHMQTTQSKQIKSRIKQKKKSFTTAFELFSIASRVKVVRGSDAKCFLFMEHSQNLCACVNLSFVA